MMDRRTLVGLLAGSTVLKAPAAMAADPVQPGRAGAGQVWVGASALKGGKGYADCPLGQLHYRRVAGRGLPLLLLHQSPLGMVEYVDIQPALARAGRTSITVDNPGYGLSDAPDGAPDVAAFADNLIPLLDQLKVAKAIVVGHHTGSAIAAALATRHPARVAAVVLHGCPLYSAAERAGRPPFASPSLVLRSDGGHLSETYRSIVQRSVPEPDNPVSATWAVIGTFLADGENKIFKAVLDNDMAPDLAAIRAPGMVMSDTADTLHPSDLAAAALRPDFTYREFSAGGPNSLMREPDRWAGLVAGFAAAHSL